MSDDNTPDLQNPMNYQGEEKTYCDSGEALTQ